MYCRIAFTAFGVSDGIRLQHQRDVPVTTGAAMLVPLSARYGGCASDECRRAAHFGLALTERAARRRQRKVPTPGATRSGFAAQSRYVGPRELKVAIDVVARSGVPFVLDAPTVSTHGALPGARDAAVLRLARRRSCPALPAAATTTTPASTTRLAASVSGSVQYDSVTPRRPTG